MKVYEIGTGYTPIPAQMGAATEIVVEGLTKAFLKGDTDITVLDIKADQRQPNELPIQEIPVPRCFSGTDVQLGIMHKLKRVVYSVALAIRLKKLLAQSEEKALLHFHNQYNLYFFLKLAGKKAREKAAIAYTVHSYVWPDEWEKIEATVKKRYFQEIYCVRHADCVLVLNDKTAEHFTRRLGVEAERIHKIGNGVNTDAYRVLPQTEVERFKAEKELTGKHVIFQVGSVCDRKNQLGALQMLCPYLKEHPDVVYAYAGGVIDGEYQARLTRLAEENGIARQVRYMGELSPGEELNRYYNAADTTIFPSKIEAFGLVIIESLAAGTPVILMEKPLFRLEEGYSVFRSEQEFLDRVDACIAADKNGEQLRKEVVDSYGWERIAEDHLRVWQDMMTAE